MSEHVWGERDTTPAAIESALRELLKERHAEHPGFVPARVLNLIVVVDRDWRGEIENRLEQVGRYNPSRTILCSVEARRTTLDALATLGSEVDPEPGSDNFALGRERIVIECGPEHLEHLDTVCDALVVPDLATVVWSPHQHPEAVDSLKRLTQVVLLDSVEEPSIESGLRRARELAERAYVVDLAWLRSTPWRERITASFDPEPWRSELRRIAGVTVRHHPESGIAGLMLFGWLASRLGWKPGAMIAEGGSLHGNAGGGRQDVRLRLEPDATMRVPGLAGITVDTASGMSLSLDRGPGGLTAKRATRKGEQSQWTVMGASRGEGGILGEGIRQALLRDPTYAPALAAASAMMA